jgi:hypothetical protein
LKVQMLMFRRKIDASASWMSFDIENALVSILVLSWKIK